MPGKGNSDATSRNLVERPDERIDQYPDSTFLHSLHISDERQDTIETDLAAIAASDFCAVTESLCITRAHMNNKFKVSLAT